MGSVCLALDSTDVAVPKETLCSGLSTAPKGSSNCDPNRWSKNFRINKIIYYRGAAKKADPLTRGMRKYLVAIINGQNMDTDAPYKCSDEAKCEKSKT